MTNTVTDALQDRYREGVKPSEPPPADISRVFVVVAEPMTFDEAAEIAKLPKTEIVAVDATVRHQDNTGAQS